MIKLTKAASPFSLAASKAASMRPPTPRSMSAIEMVSVEATGRAVEVVLLLLPLCCCSSVDAVVVAAEEEVKEE